jgi:hypothetical protein
MDFYTKTLLAMFFSMLFFLLLSRRKKKKNNRPNEFVPPMLQTAQQLEKPTTTFGDIAQEIEESKKHSPILAKKEVSKSELKNPLALFDKKK